MDKHRVHQPKPSLFSSRSGFQDYRGFFNLAIFLLIVSNARVALENLIKYGVLVNPLVWFVDLSQSLSPYSPYVTNLFILIGSNATILTVFGVERLLAAGLVKNWFAILTYLLLFAAHLTLPAWAVLQMDGKSNPLYSYIALSLIVIEFLKLISYVHVNYWYRNDVSRQEQQRSQNGHLTTPNTDRAKPSSTLSMSVPDGSESTLNGSASVHQCRNRNFKRHLSQELGHVPNTLTSNDTPSPLKHVTSPSAQASSEVPSDSIFYPKNLTLRDIYYFIFAPTLCYELDFPRTQSRSVRFILKRIAEQILFACVILALSQQWIVPLIRNSLAPFSEMDIGRCVERVLKLAIPNHIIWLMLFYLYFHSFLNLLAELLRFADREFYSDFWNSDSVATFWRQWNIPAHRWAIRHVYRPIVRNGWGKFLASVAVFSISAFFHEYLVSVPLKMFRLWACTGMFLQLPLGMFTERWLKGGRTGNIFVWGSLILGQPMAILMYLHDWYLINFPHEHY